MILKRAYNLNPTHSQDTIWCGIVLVRLAQLNRWGSHTKNEIHNPRMVSRLLNAGVSSLRLLTSPTLPNKVSSLPPNIPGMMGGRLVALLCSRPGISFEWSMSSLDDFGGRHLLLAAAQRWWSWSQWHGSDASRQVFEFKL